MIFGGGLMYKGGMITARRKNDAVIAVCQKNDEERIEIEKVNRGAEFLTGYPDAELKGKPFVIILPSNLQDIVESYVEFEPGGNDLASVLKRTREFHIRDKKGQEVPVSLKVFYVPGEDKNARFELLMRDITLQEKMDLIKAQLIEEQHSNLITDVDTDLPNAEFMRFYVNAVHEFIESNNVEATFVTALAESYYDTIVSQGKLAGDRLMKTLGERANSSARAEDAVTYLGEGVLGFLLFDCSAENAPAALNRILGKMLQTEIEVSEGVTVDTYVNTVYHQISHEDSFETIVQLCYDALNQTSESEGNKLSEVN